MSRQAESKIKMCQMINQKMISIPKYSRTLAFYFYKDKKNLIADNISDQKLRLTVITKDDI